MLKDTTPLAQALDEIRLAHAAFFRGPRARRPAPPAHPSPAGPGGSPPAAPDDARVEALADHVLALAGRPVTLTWRDLRAAALGLRIAVTVWHRGKFAVCFRDAIRVPDYGVRELAHAIAHARLDTWWQVPYVCDPDQDSLEERRAEAFARLLLGDAEWTSTPT